MAGAGVPVNTLPAGNTYQGVNTGGFDLNAIQGGNYSSVNWANIVGFNYNDPQFAPLFSQLAGYIASTAPDTPQLGQWITLFQTNPDQAFGAQGAAILKANPTLAATFWNAWQQAKTTPEWGQVSAQFSDITTHLGTFFDMFDPNATPGDGTPGSGLTDIQKSAKAEIESTLGQYGLATLGDFAWKEYLNGIPIEQIMLDIRGTPEYKTRFPAMDALAQKGHAMSEAAYIAYEKQVTSVMRAAGMPEGMYDQPADFKGFLENELSANEVGQRVQDWLNFASTAPTINQAELQQFYGVDASGIAAYFLDPERALPLLEKQANSALIGSQSIQGGYGQLARQQAEYVAGLGIKPEQTLKGFQQLVTEKQLFNPLPGEGGGVNMDRDQQLQATFGGNQEAITALEQEARKRVAVNEGNYNYLADQHGSTVGGAQQT